MIDDDLENRELPAGEGSFLCECGYESDPFFFLDNLHFCKECRRIDKPLRVPFLYQHPKCTVCCHQFELADRIRTGELGTAYFNSIPTENPSVKMIRCPSCNKNTLGINEYGIHYLMAEQNLVTPQKGQLMHVKILRYDHPELPFLLFCPRLSSEYALSYRFSNRDITDLQDGHHEFLVMEVNKKDPKIVWKYLHPLTPKQSEGF